MPYPDRKSIAEERAEYEQILATSPRGSLSWHTARRHLASIESRLRMQAEQRAAEALKEAAEVMTTRLLACFRCGKHAAGRRYDRLPACNEHMSGPRTEPRAVALDADALRREGREQVYALLEADAKYSEEVAASLSNARVKLETPEYTIDVEARADGTVEPSLAAAVGIDQGITAHESATGGAREESAGMGGAVNAPGPTSGTTGRNFSGPQVVCCCCETAPIPLFGPPYCKPCGIRLWMEG